MNTTIVKIEKQTTDVREIADGYALGTILILDRPMHLEFVRVRNTERGQECDGNSPMAEDCWERVRGDYDYPMQVVALPDITGEWIAHMHPHGL